MQNLFGTDGIRGLVEISGIEDLDCLNAFSNDRKVTPGLMRLVGESLGHCLNLFSKTSETVVIGWDERPNNATLACHLTLGLKSVGIKVIHIGICATPLLHYSTLKLGCAAGCMITASHNPVSDSGVKIFDENGYKTFPQIEETLTQTAFGLANEERSIDATHKEEMMIPDMDYSGNDIEHSWATETHQEWLNERLSDFEINYGSIISNLQGDGLVADPLLLDSSKGSAHYWLSQFLEKRGIRNHEISTFANAMNDNCGAGELSPNDSWTWEEVENSQHSLVRLLDKAPPGIVLAAALDGDGDRCLLLKSTDVGVEVVDGDEMADVILRSMATKTNHLHVAASIESELSLLTNLERLNCTYLADETAVGDRWLAFALGIKNAGGLISSDNSPMLIGVEDSGHLVLPSPHPSQENTFSLVGDGAASLFAYLSALAQQSTFPVLERGYKNRKSVKGIDRSKWDGLNELSDEVEVLLKQYLEQNFNVEHWVRDRVEGEKNLMRIKAKIDSRILSIGIRNSGTQEKISISVRMDSYHKTDIIDSLIEEVSKLLELRMS